MIDIKNIRIGDTVCFIDPVSKTQKKVTISLIQDFNGVQQIGFTKPVQMNLYLIIMPIDCYFLCAE
jgi:hypothetical protein